MIENETGVRLSRKDWRYSLGGRAWVGSSVFSGNGVDVDLGRKSRLILEGCATEKRYQLDKPNLLRELGPVQSPSMPAAAVKSMVAQWRPSNTASLEPLFDTFGMDYFDVSPNAPILDQQMPTGDLTYLEFLADKR